MRPHASFAALSIGFALLTAGCPATYITVSSDGGAAGQSAGGAGGAYATGGFSGAYAGSAGYAGSYYPAGVGGGAGFGVGGGAGFGVGGGGEDPCYNYYCSPYYAPGTPEYASCIQMTGGAGTFAGWDDPWGCLSGGTAGYGGTGGVGGAAGCDCDPGFDPGCGVAGTGAGGAAGIGCDPSVDPFCGTGGTGVAGASAGTGADPCAQLFHDPSAYCACYYPINRPDYFTCLAHFAPTGTGGVGGAAGAAGGCAGAPGDPAYDDCAGEPVDAGIPLQ